MTRVPATLVRRLETPAPRYTSYPTVPVWSEQFGASEQVTALQAAAARPDEPLSLYIHIPFCKELCSYCGCNVVVTRDQARVERYLAALHAEIALVSEQLGARRRVSRLHLGGGTPTFLDERQLESLWKTITSSLQIAPGAELAVEIDPVVTRNEQIALLGSFGFNRLSMGVQDFDPTVQAAVHRVQSVEETALAMQRARAAGFQSINFDLIYGLPHQTVASFAATMDRVVELAPDRVAAFSFAYLPKSLPNQRSLPQAAIPTGPEKLALLETVQDRLTAAGMMAIGMDHFARPRDELARALVERRLWRDFQGYTSRRLGTTVAIGASAISDFGDAYAQNEHALGKYEAAIASGRLATARGIRLTDDDRRRREVIVQLMCNGWVDLGEDGERYFAREQEALVPFVADGLVATTGRELTLTALGRLFVRNVAMLFDAHLQQPTQRSFSASV